jgi:hypothetical protein
MRTVLLTSLIVLFTIPTSSLQAAGPLKISRYGVSAHIGYTTPTNVEHLDSESTALTGFRVNWQHKKKHWVAYAGWTQGNFKSNDDGDVDIQQVSLGLKRHTGWSNNIFYSRFGVHVTREKVGALVPGSAADTDAKNRTLTGLHGGIGLEFFPDKQFSVSLEPIHFAASWGQTHSNLSYWCGQAELTVYF